MRPNAKPQQIKSRITDDDVRLLAYLKWEADGKPFGHELFFWVEAERELRNERMAAGE
jgi:hypothetical protein